MKRFRPVDTVELTAFVREAAACRTQLHICGLSTKAGLGNLALHDLDESNEIHMQLDLSAFTGICFYEPDELILCAQAATPIDEIESLLASQGQELAFEPMSFSAIYGTGAGSLGGAYMTNQSGPRRLKAGALRDHVLGVRAVNGRGESFKAGGRVVKNVTGYDLSRGLAGSFGTLAIATELILKVLPRAEMASTLILSNLDSHRAVSALCAATGAPVDVSGAAHLDAFAAQKLGFDHSLTALRLEGIKASVAARFDRLSQLLQDYGSVDQLEGTESSALWRAIRDVAPLAEPRDRIIWKISAAPMAGPKILEAVNQHSAADGLFDWSGGLLWLAMEAGRDASALLVRKAIAENGGGHATLIRASNEIRTRIPVFEPQPEALSHLTQRLKAEFDPAGILEVRRMSLENRYAD
jgi:glycolate oxidase FAD binding subunit